MALPPAAFFDEAIVDADGTLAETTSECQEGMDIAYNGVWGYHPLVVALANTGEPLFLVNRSSNRPSTEGAAERCDQASTLCREAGFRRSTFRGDTDFSQTRHVDRWDTDGVRFVVGYDARANVIACADALPAGAWTPQVRRPPYEAQTKPRVTPANVNAGAYPTGASQIGYPHVLQRLALLAGRRKQLVIDAGPGQLPPDRDRQCPVA